jgi:hypothetical protein
MTLISPISQRKTGKTAEVSNHRLMRAQAKQLTLAQGKRTNYVIIYPARATPAEKRAVEELQSHLKQITGAEFTAQTDAHALPRRAILLSNPQTNRHIRALRVSMPLQKLGEDGYIVCSMQDHLILGGGRPRGTLYAVYGFLEDDLGCRWYAPDATHIPKKATLHISPLNRTEIPAFEYREPFYTEAWDKDWAARNRCNGSFMRLDESTGGKIGYHPFVHSFYAILPPEQYFKDHPEYYSELEGVRKVEGGQLCLTNPDVLRLTIEKVRNWIHEQPQAKIFSVSQNDWYGYCTCAECKRVMEDEDAPSGVVLRFVNAVAEAVTREHTDKLIDTLAYQWTEKPPKRVRPHANVRVRMAPIGNCFAHPIDTCSENRVPYDNFKAWSAITDNLYIWHYNTNFAHYLLPFPDFDELEGTTRAYKRLKVKGIFYEGAYPPGGGGELAELRSWVMAKLLWDPKQDAWKLIDEFLKGYYSKAAKPIGDYLRMLHEAVKRENIHFRIYDHPTKVGYLRRELVDRAESLFEQAERTVANEPTALQHVQKARLAIDYTRLAQAQNDAERAKYAPIVAEKIRRFGIGQVREGQPVEEFLKSIGQ